MVWRRLQAERARGRAYQPRNIVLMPILSGSLVLMVSAVLFNRQRNP